MFGRVLGLLLNWEKLVDEWLDLLLGVLVSRVHAKEEGNALIDKFIWIWLGFLGLIRLLVYFLLFFLEFFFHLSNKPLRLGDILLHKFDLLL